MIPYGYSLRDQSLRIQDGEADFGGKDREVRPEAGDGRKGGQGESQQSGPDFVFVKAFSEGVGGGGRNVSQGVLL